MADYLQTLKNLQQKHRRHFPDLLQALAFDREEHIPTDPIEHLTCCCCGRGTKGRQWWNRDTGYGLCNDCIAMNGVADVDVGKEASGFGIRGVHWDIRL